MSSLLRSVEPVSVDISEKKDQTDDMLFEAMVDKELKLDMFWIRKDGVEGKVVEEVSVKTEELDYYIPASGSPHTCTNVTKCGEGIWFRI